MKDIEIKEQFKIELQKAVRAYDLRKIDEKKFRELLQQALVWIEKVERGKYNNKE